MNLIAEAHTIFKERRNRITVTTQHRRRIRRTTVGNCLTRCKRCCRFCIACIDLCRYKLHFCLITIFHNTMLIKFLRLYATQFCCLLYSVRKSIPKTKMLLNGFCNNAEGKIFLKKKLLMCFKSKPIFFILVQFFSTV